MLTSCRSSLVHVRPTQPLGASPGVRLGLYLSTRTETAMSEVRPWIGSLVPCALFRAVRDLNIVDLSVNHGKGVVFYFEEPNAKKKEEAVWTHIDQAFSTPITSEDDVAEYVPTQIIAELFKSEGYDGIAYKSAFGEDGYNIALFNIDDAKLVSCILHEVRAAQFTFQQKDNPYWVEEDGTIKTLTIEVIGPAKSSPNSPKKRGPKRTLQRGSGRSRGGARVGAATQRPTRS
jgi:hypothetical protein